jgi:ABC-type enterochelin transport system permease subunit
MFPPKGPNHYGQPPPYGGQQPYGQIVRLYEGSCCFFVGRRFVMNDNLCSRHVLYFSLVALDLQPRQQQVALMVVGLVGVEDKGLLHSMEGLMHQCMAPNRWSTITALFFSLLFSR